MLLGVDVSTWQGDVDWVQVRASGRVYGFAKATEGTGYRDSHLAKNRAGMAQNGFVLAGLYHFAHRDNDPVAEANHFLEVVGILAPHEVPVLDSEGPAVGQPWATTWAAIVEHATSRRPGLYCNTSDFRSTYGDTLPLGFSWWWAAQYSNSAPTNAAWTFWQYTDKATVPGVTGRCDDSKFLGTEGDLAALVKGPAPVSSVRNRVLEVARSQVGVAEDPPHSNHVPYWDWYGPPGQGNPWCACFVSWCFDQGGATLNIQTPKGFVYVPAGTDWFRSHGQLRDQPQPGFIALYPAHTGIVEVVHADGTFGAIEGNEGDAVRRVNRHWSEAVGFGDPLYADDQGETELTEPEWDRMTELIRTVVLDVVNKQSVTGAADPRSPVVAEIVKHGDQHWVK